MGMPDAELIKQCQQGNTDSFGELVDRYKDSVYNIAYCMLRSVEDAQDISQEAFISVYRTISRFDTEREFTPWIFRIVTNLCINKLKKKELNTVPLASLEENAENGLPIEIADNSSNPLQIAENSELREIIENSIAELPPKYRAVVMLRYIENMSYSEIASTLDANIGTIKTYLHRGRKKLKERLETIFSERGAI